MQYDSLFDLFTDLIAFREEEEVFEGETPQTSRGDYGTLPEVDSNLLLGGVLISQQPAEVRPLPRQ